MNVTMEQTDEQLKAWTLGILADAQVTFDAPSAAKAGSRVSLYLMGLSPLPPTHGRPLAPFQLNLHYLVTVSDANPVKAHHMLAQLAFAAMENREIELDLTALPAATWSAFGVAPQPCFVMRLALRQARTQAAVRVVEHLPVIRASTMEQ